MENPMKRNVGVLEFEFFHVIKSLWEWEVSCNDN